MGTRLPRFSRLVVCFCFFTIVSFGQQVSPRPLITQPVVESQLTTLKGNTHPLAQPQFDIGAAPPELPMNRMLLVLKRSPEQEYGLRTLLDNQQDKVSAHYHKWLTPDEFGAQFGPADQDVQIVTGWLQSHGFEVNRVSHGRTVVEFSGTEGQVEEALHTSIHKYAVNGEEHWANASDPQIPSALTPVVAGVASLNNFPRKPLSNLVGTYSPKTRSLTSVNPQFTFGSGNCYQGTCYAVGPADFGKIYNVQPLWTSSLDGAGQTIAIVGESDINLQDVRDFRNLFGLPANDPHIIYDGPNPGPQSDESEADIDVEWSGAIAPNATIDFVVSESTETTFGVDLSAVYIIDHNLAPVMSESYGACELALGTSGNHFYSTLWAQAAAQGITVILASGDSGANGCTYGPAKYGLNVSGFASTPFNVAIGGTDFNDLLNPQKYWSFSNTTSTQESANSYIPETTWNLSCTNNILLGDFGWPNNSENNCNNSQLENAGLDESVGGSGGKSSCTSNSQILGSCSGGYTKPSWQVAPGVPADGKRDIPDVSLFASNGVMNNFYIYCEADLPYPYSADCAIGQYGAAGGTSFGAPIFAGVMALINQQTNTTEGQGNANYVLYKLASQQTASTCNSATGSGASCVFNDVTSGTIAMPCVAGSPNCNVATAGHTYGILSGYGTGTGYDLATGLGSLNVANLAAKWSSVAFRPTTISLGLSPTSSLTHGQSVTVTGSVAASSGTGTPTGKVSLLTSTGLAVDGFTLANGAISGSTNLLPGGTYAVTAHYAGDPTFGGSDSTPVSITVGKENSSTQIELVTFDWNGRQISGNASGAVYGSPYLFRVNVLNSAGAVCSPNPLGESGCPTGTVNLTDNSSALDGGAFTLNSLGYTEDQIVQFPGGSNVVKASYAGDNSFNASSAGTTYSITPAPTTISTPNLCCGGTGTVGVGFSTNVAVQSQSNGAAPNGTVTFLANGNPISGTVSYQQTPGSASNPIATLTASFTSSTSAFAAAGNYTITASYSGDANYATSTSSGTAVKVQYPMPRISMSSPGVTVAAGTSVTVSAVVATGLKNVPIPTGTVTFYYNTSTVPVAGNVGYVSTTDSNGNVALQASITFIPEANLSISASFNGDSSYPAASGSGLEDIFVTGSDFFLLPSLPSVTTNRGAPGMVQIYVFGQSSFAGSVAFAPTSCSGLPKESTCSFTPSSMTAPGYVNLVVNTTAPHATAAIRNSSPGEFLACSFGVPFAALILANVRRRLWPGLVVLCLLASLLPGLSCGGGSGGGGGGGGTDPGTPPGSYTITVTATSGSGSTAITHTTTFTLVVQ
jgi:Pro-kumamolisin, activation domain/Bacterial Ig-like domain (group 3)